MNYLIFTAVLTAFLGIGGYQQGSEFFGPSPDGLGHDPHYNPGQLNSSQTGPWPPLVSPHSTLSIAMCTSMKLLKIQCTRKGLLLVDDCVPHHYRFDWIPARQPVAIHTASGTYCNWPPPTSSNPRKMNHLIFTAVFTACLGIGGYQQGPEFFGPSSEGLGHDPHYGPG
ncbi:hypothetical protein DSO57_1012449 [Entomophthora muscae]|uniref:Uncharacterized protein n=1 Tax=Entomophthora muscae TaxID=34485 RepID=A0ACC2S815_9FUNG|nr:hypothetical protein DSO57_1012449 [Entomophthora muscae]